MAKRLSGELKNTPVWQSQDQYLQVSELRPLADLVAALTDRPASDLLSGKDRLDCKAFQVWAIQASVISFMLRSLRLTNDNQANLMPALDKLFGYFLESREQRGKIDALSKSKGLIYENRKAKEPLQHSRAEGEKHTADIALA